MFLHISLILSKSYYIRHCKSQLYMSVKTGLNNSTILKTERSPGLIELEYADIFNIVRTKARYDEFEILVNDDSDRALDIYGSVKELVYYPSGGKNQHFKLIPLDFENVYNISFNDRCLTYKKDDNNFGLAECKEQLETQMFEILDVEKLNDAMAQIEDSNINGEIPTLKQSYTIKSTGVLYSGHLMLQNIYNLINDTRNAVYSLGIEITSKDNDKSKDNKNDLNYMFMYPNKVKLTLAGMAKVCRNFR